MLNHTWLISLLITEAKKVKDQIISQINEIEAVLSKLKTKIITNEIEEDDYGNIYNILLRIKKLVIS